MSESLKIVHVAATTNGAPWLLELMRRQRRRGHLVEAIIPPGEGTIPVVLQHEGFTYHTAALDLMARTHILTGTLMVHRLARLLEQVRPDIVQFHLFPSIIIGRLASWIADVPLRFSMIPGTYYLEAPVLRDIDFGTARFDTRVIATCERTRELYREAGIPEDRLELMYYGADEKRFDPSLYSRQSFRDDIGISSETPLIGLVAFFYPPATESPFSPPHLVGRSIKGHDIVLRSIPRVLKTWPDATFAFIGGGWGEAGEEHREEMRELALPFHGKLLEEDLDHVVSSLREAIPRCRFSAPRTKLGRLA